MTEAFNATYTMEGTGDRRQFVARRRLPAGRDFATSGSASLTVEWDDHWTYDRPETWTEEEEVRVFKILIKELQRWQCHDLIDGLPEAVVPVVLRQLQDIAEYETRLWKATNNPGFLAGSRERWVSLPIVS